MTQSQRRATYASLIGGIFGISYAVISLGDTFVTPFPWEELLTKCALIGGASGAAGLFIFWLLPVLIIKLFQNTEARK